MGARAVVDGTTEFGASAVGGQSVVLVGDSRVIDDASVAGTSC